MNGANNKTTVPGRKKTKRSLRAKVATHPATTSLCQKCGLCCNGVLFEDVELQPGDNRRRLAQLGFEFWRKGRKSCFLQPCQAFDGTLCRVYEFRPCHCQAFSCRLLQRVQDEEITLPTALRTIRRAKQMLVDIEWLGAEGGDTHSQVPLMERYAQTMAQPIDLSKGARRNQRHSQMLTDMDRLMRFLDRNFRI